MMVVLGASFPTVSTVLLMLTLLAALRMIGKLKHENEALFDYVNELLEEESADASESPEIQGARIAVTESGAVEFANAWLTTMPSDTVRDFVVKFDGWDKKDWTMWVRLPWGKYEHNKAEVDFAVGRNIMKEAERSA